MKPEHKPRHDELILSAINHVWRRTFGDVPTLQFDTTLKEMIEAIESTSSWFHFNHLDLQDFRFHLESRFEIRISQHEWIEFLNLNQWNRKSRSVFEKYSQDWTVAQLIDFIHERQPDVSFEPINICGKDCTPAGVFYGLRTLAGSNGIAGDEIGPSTAIACKLSGSKLTRFWNQIRCLTDDAVPELKCRFSSKVLGLFALFLSYCIGSAFLLPGSSVLAAFLVFFVITIALFQILSPETTFEDFVFVAQPPPDIRTFRDLAEYIAKQPAVS